MPQILLERSSFVFDLSQTSKLELEELIFFPTPVPSLEPQKQLG
jgi:hypothetical protein